MTQDDLFSEKLLVQRYQLKEIIGVGGMGTVYRAEDKVSNRNNVAVKILTRSLPDMNMINQFQREATVSALLSEMSPNIVKVTDYGVNEEKVPFYVMEYLDGENLKDIINIHDIPLEQFLDFTIQICRAMHIAHNGIFFAGQICPVIHRDLKPGNIFIVEDDAGKPIVKVLDFGIAKLVKDEQGETEHFMGTPRYCSPEQLQGESLDNRSDIYSLGMVMYYMLSKKLPWDVEVDSVGEWFKAHTQLPPNRFSLDLNIPEELENLVLKCLNKSVKDRPQSVGEVIQKLEQISRKIQGNKNSELLQQRQHQASAKPAKSAIEQFLYQTTWPKNKPKQKIVFSRILTYQQKSIPTVCTMLEQEDIDKRKNNIRYSRFIFQSFPHPMLLWLTVLYNSQDGPRWLPCYLDLKTKVGQQLVQALSESKQYFLLFFSLQNSETCYEILPFKVMLKQRTNLKQWANISKMLNVQHHDEAIISRRRLKDDLEKLKPEIMLELSKTHTEELNR